MVKSKISKNHTNSLITQTTIIEQNHTLKVKKPKTKALAKKLHHLRGATFLFDEILWGSMYSSDT